MKFLLEFGQRSNTRMHPQREAIEIPSQRLAQCLAAAMVRVFSNHIDLGDAANETYWKLSGSTPRASWEDPEQYIVLTRQDGRTKFQPAKDTF